jgi:hypothetical protein
LRVELGKIARILRSKNAGPFTLTIDVILDTRECMEELLGELTKDAVAKAYNIDSDSVEIVPYPIVNAIKINIPRRVASGEPGDTDVYGTQWHIPLSRLQVEVSRCPTVTASR